MGKRKQKRFKRGCCGTNERLPETNHTSKPPPASAVKSNIAEENLWWIIKCQTAENNFSQWHKNSEQQCGSWAYKMPLFEHNSSMVASTKPTADIMDWALILEAIIYLSHIGCQMDVCLEKKQKQIKKEKAADYKAEDERELHNTEGSFSRGHRSYWLHGSDKKWRAGGVRDKMATYKHLLQRAFLQVL